MKQTMFTRNKSRIIVFCIFLLTSCFVDAEKNEKNNDNTARGAKRRLRGVKRSRSMSSYDVLPVVDDKVFRDDGFPRRRLASKSKSKSSKSSKAEESEPSGSTRSSSIDPSIKERYILHCDPIIELSSCWDMVVDMGDTTTRLVHALATSNALAVETDLASVEALEANGFWLTKDSERQPLHLEGSLQHLHRSLSEESQQTIGYNLDMIRAVEAWSRFGVQGEGVKVCIMDTGVQLPHPDLDEARLDGWNGTSNEFVTPWNEDLAGHGTHVTGIIGASDNDEGYVGVAPKVDIFFVRVFDDRGKFFGSDVAAAAEACRDAGSHIITMSLGGQGYEEEEHAVFQELFERHGILSVASSGNTRGPERIYPAAYDNVISVAASDENAKLTGFTTFNSHVDIAAPGADIPSTYIASKSEDPDFPYASLSGTSMAAPHVVGVLALMKSYKPDASAEELLYALYAGTQELESKVNLGQLDALQSLEILEAGIDLSEELPVTCLQAELSLYSDQYGGEIGYRLRRLSDRKIFWKGVGLESLSEYMESSCLDPDDCYEFVLRDAYGDGILEPGWVQLKYNDEGLFGNRKFGKFEKITFGDTC